MTDASRKDRLAGWQRGCLVAAGGGSLLCAVLALLDLRDFLRGYLLGFLFCWVITVGGLGLMLLHRLVGGGWGELVRPFLQAGAATLPVLAILFLGVALGTAPLYPWATAEALVEYPTLQHKARYLNPWFFFGRGAAYFLIWIFLAGWLCELPRFRLPPPKAERLALFSAVGLAVLVVTVSFAAIDWIMSLEPDWYSTMFGALTAMGGAVAALALAAGAAAWVARSRSLRPPAWQPEVLGDLSSLLMAFLMLWAYFAFSQYLIVWSGNLPEETTWYIRRLSGTAGWLALCIVLLHFAVPFALLLSRDVKRSPAALCAIAALILLTHFIYLFWTVVPSFGGGVAPHVGDVLVPATMGCLWMAAFLWNLPRPLWRVASDVAVSEDVEMERVNPVATHEAFHA